MTDFLESGQEERQGPCDARQRPSPRDGVEVVGTGRGQPLGLKMGESEARGGQVAGLTPLGSPAVSGPESGVFLESEQRGWGPSLTFIVCAPVRDECKSQASGTHRVWRSAHLLGPLGRPHAPSAPLATGELDIKLMR